MVSKKVSFLFFFVFLSIAQSSPQKIPYKITPQDTLHLFVFQPDSAAQTGSAIVFFFGGGWVQGNPKQFFSHCQYLASRGMVAFSAEYRIKNRHGTTPFECVQDGISAVRWVRAHANEFQIDPQKIVAAGGSAGGHVAACTAFTPNLQSADIDTTIPSVPNAMVLFNPVVNTGPNGFGAKRIGKDAIKISPMHHIKFGRPPTIIFHGTADTTVPFEQVERFCLKMRKAGNTCRLVPFEGMQHAFFNVGRHDNKPYQKTITLMDEFLTQLHFLSESGHSFNQE